MKWLALLLTALPALAAAEFSVDSTGGFVTLSNGRNIRAVVAPDHGGELSGLAVHFDGQWHELIYRAMDYEPQPGWRGKAPLLWPSVGVSWLEDTGKHHYRLDGETLPMPFHGFARDQAWQVTGRETGNGSASVTLVMRRDPSTQAFYPFEFDFRVAYRIEKDRLSLVYTVEAGAGNRRAMPFVIGNHITFRSPLVDGAGPLQFHGDFPLLLQRDENGAFSGRTEASPYTGWQDVAGLPHRSAVSLGGLSGPAELSIRDASGLQLRLVHRASSEPAEPAIRFNLWADAKAGFFSPEPWLGTQNALNSGAGLILLEPGERWHWQIDIIPSRVASPGEKTIEVSP